MFRPDKLPNFPPVAEQMLGPEVWAKLEAIRTDASLSVLDKRRQIHQVMETVPVETLQKLPPPPELAGLPDDTKAILKALYCERGLTLEQKKEKFEALLKTLPADQQKILVG